MGGGGRVTILPLNAIVSQRACNSPSFHVLYSCPKIITNIFCYFWLDVQIYRGHPLTLISAMGGGGGVTILPLNAIVSQRVCNSPSLHVIVSQCACNSPSLHVLYLGSKIVNNIFCYFWLDVQIYRGHTLTLISALGGGGGGHYTTIKCNYFPACM